MPDDGPADAELRARIARWIRLIHDPNDGRAKLRGVFYLTEKNLRPDQWQGGSDDLWGALDDTCDLVIAEYFHTYDSVMTTPVDQYIAMLDRLPRWLDSNGRSAQISVARNKYTALHSCYYGPYKSNGTPASWAGVNSAEHFSADLESYFAKLFRATRQSRFGKSRVCFSPLLDEKLDPRMLPILVDELGEDVAGFRRRGLQQ